MTRILVDYDSTIADTQTHRLEWTNKQFGTNYTKAEVNSWNYPGFADEHREWMWSDECFMNLLFQEVAPEIDGAVSGVLWLIDQGHEPMIVSDRPPELFEVTRDWLDRHGLDMVRLLFTRHKHSMSKAVSGMLTKVEAAHKYRLKWVIEDGPHHAEKLAPKPYIERVFLLDMPYNQEVSHEKVTRCYDWDEIVLWIAHADVMAERGELVEV